ncbi:MAG: glycosyltransferase family 1 protein [Rhodospirillaceae bacterium]|nr:glycosyltransferase family 1 protein [Rhodospirillaceae bacterium]
MDFYAARPQLQNAPYDVQMDALLDDEFSGVHIWTRPLKAHGFETLNVIANNPFTQRAWMRENGYQVGEKVDSAFATLRQIHDFAPDVFYTNDVVTFHSGFFKAVEKRPTVIAGWRGFPLPANADLSAYDLILTSFDRMFGEAVSKGAKHVARFHPGFPEDSPILREPREIKYDVVISGSITSQHAQRINIINMILEMSRETPGFSVGLFTAGAQFLSPLAQQLNKGARWSLEMLRTIRSGRILVNIDVDAFGGQPPNMRLIEATGAGAFLLTTHHPELVNFFEPGKEIETFRTPQELFSKINYYLAMPERAGEIARRGQERCMYAHSRSVRAGWFAEIMRGALSF